MFAAADPQAQDAFGARLLYKDGWLFVGTERSVAPFGGQLLAYRVGEDGSTILTDTIVPDPAYSGYAFVSSLAYEGGTLVVGASGESSVLDRAGAVFVYDISAEGVASLRRTIRETDAGREHLFGTSVAIGQGLLLVGSSGRGANGQRVGAAYVFDSATGEQLSKLEPHDGAAHDDFGSQVALSGNVAVVGVPNHAGVTSYSGTVYLFDARTGEELTEIIPADGAYFEFFGFRLSIDGTKLFASAHSDINDGVHVGSVYAYDISDPRSPSLIQKIVPDDVAIVQKFGSSMAVGDGRLIVGVEGDSDSPNGSGSAYVYDVSDLRPLVKLVTANVTPLSGFGYTDVGVSSQWAFVGDRLNWFGGVLAAGAVFRFDLDPLPCCAADFARPYGVLNFDDVAAFLRYFNQTSPLADLAERVYSFNAADVTAFLDAYLAGCPTE